MWSIIDRPRHLPFYMAGRLDCVNDAAMERVSSKRGLRVPHCEIIKLKWRTAQLLPSEGLTSDTEVKSYLM